MPGAGPDSEKPTVGKTDRTPALKKRTLVASFQGNGGEKRVGDSFLWIQQRLQ